MDNKIIEERARSWCGAGNKCKMKCTSDKAPTKCKNNVQIAKADIEWFESHGYKKS